MADGGERTLYLVDGSAYLFRAFFAIRGLSNSEGLPTNAVYGFTSMLLKLVEQEQPDYLAVVFDRSEDTFRKELYPDYKANRPPPPADLVPQIPLVREVTRAFSMPCLELSRYEADDIIGTLAGLGREQGVKTVIVSSDKDFMQLVDGDISMLDTMKDKRYGPGEVFEKMGVRPEQVIDYLALMGDSVDNIPGVKGIGKKTAAALLTEYSDLDGIYANIQAFKGKRRENLVNDRDKAYLSQQLATIRRDLDLGIALEDLRRREPDKVALTEFFRRMEFKSWHRRFHAELGDNAPGDAPMSDAVAAPALSRDGDLIVRTDEALDAMLEAFRAADIVAFDTETTSLSPHSAELVGLSFATDRDHAWYVPVGHRTLDSGPQLPRDAVLERLRPWFEDADAPKAAQNAKYDLQVLRCHGVAVRGVAFDTMLASYLVDAGKYAHSLDNIALDRLNHKTIPFKEVAGSGKQQVTFDQVPVDKAAPYACEDAQVVRVLADDLSRDLDEAGLRGLHDTLELPLLHVLADMELTGVRVDVPHLLALSVELGATAKRLESEAHEAAGRPFSLGSPKQLSELLFGEIGLEPIKKTKTGFSTDQSVLEQLAPQHPIPQLVLEWRQVSKLKSTYTDVLPTLVHPKTGRIHTSFNQAVAATGRLSSTDPNLQNIPVRTAEGRKIREAFIPADGHVLLAADYSQIELRVLAHLAGETAMQRAFREGADIHQRTAMELFELGEGDVGREERAMAKTINFGVLYGMSAFRLAREQGISRGEAQAFIDRYFARFPRILAWKESVLEQARATREVATLFGRIRRLPDIAARNGARRAAAERVAINTPVQGSAADIIKRAMLRIHPQLETAAPGTRMVLQVHDELVFEVPEARVDAARELVAREMEGAFDLAVPLEVNMATGRSWLEAH